MKCGVDREGPSFEPHVSPVALPREGDCILLFNFCEILFSVIDTLKLSSTMSHSHFQTAREMLLNTENMKRVLLSVNLTPSNLQDRKRRKAAPAFE